MKRLVPIIILVLAGASCSDADGAATTSAETESPISTTAQTLVTPPASSREVSFPSGDLELAGTLRLPTAGGAPGVVLIHGSGPNSRIAAASSQLNMAFGFEIPIFSEIGDALQEAGFAVLTYDKRTCGPFNGCAANGYPPPGNDLVVDDFIADAEAAVAFLREQAEVDPAQVSVVGHSQGAEFVTIMLEADPSLASGVLLAGSFGPIDEVIEFQYTSSVELLTAMGLTEEQVRENPGAADLGAWVDGLAAIRNGGNEAVGGSSALFWQSWLDIGQAKIDAVARIEQPVLVLAGGYDWNVPATEAEAWSDLLADAGVEHTKVVLDCVTHALNCVSEPDFTALTIDDIGEHVAPDVIDALVGFLAE